MINPTSQLLIYQSPLAKISSGTEEQLESTGLGAFRVGMVDLSRAELARTGKYFTGGLTAVGGGVATVTNLPTTTAPVYIHNNALPMTGKCLVLDRVTCYFASGTAGVAGVTLFVGVTAAPTVSPPTANAANCSVQATRGWGSSVALVTTAQTVPSGTAYMTLGGIMEAGSPTVTGCSYSTFTEGSFIAPPNFGFILGIMGSVTGTPLWCAQATWAEIEMDLP
jgi:hypothetical protein